MKKFADARATIEVSITVVNISCYFKILVSEFLIFCWGQMQFE